MEQLIYELNGQKYLLVHYLILESNAKKTARLFNKYKVIEQGIKKIHRGFFTPSYIIMNILIPEKYLNQFNKEDNGF